MKLERAYKFSLSRLHEFQSCKRAYYYKYILSWEGWDKFADKDKKEAYKLKNLLHSKIWIKNIFTKSVKLYLVDLHLRKKQNLPVQKNLFSSIVSSKFNSAWDEAEFALKDNPQNIKFTSIFELFYNSENKPLAQFKDSLLKNLSSLAESFLKSRVHSELISIPYLSFYCLNEFENFEINGIKICCMVDFAIQKGAEMEIINIYTGEPCENRSWDIIAAISEIFAKQKFPLAKYISVRNLFFRPDELSVWTSRPEKEIVKMIQELSSQMVEFESSCKNINNAEKNFNHCPFCEFRKLCRNNESTNI